MAVSSRRLMVLTGVHIAAPFGHPVEGATYVTFDGKVVLGTNAIFGNGRRGPIGPGPGSALLIRCARCRWTPCEPRYPISSDVLCPRPFSTDVLHCWMYCDGAFGSSPVKLTVVCPSTA